MKVQDGFNTEHLEPLRLTRHSWADPRRARRIRDAVRENNANAPRSCFPRFWGLGDCDPWCAQFNLPRFNAAVDRAISAPWVRPDIKASEQNKDFNSGWYRAINA